MKKWVSSKVIWVLALLIVCSTIFAINPMTGYADSIGIDGVHTFYNSSFTLNGSSTATSNDGYFLLTGSKYTLDADEVSIWIDDAYYATEETVYFEVSSRGSLGSFVLDSVDLGEFGDGVFNNVYIEGYANGRKIYTTTPYSNPQDGILVPNFPLDFSAAAGKAIDAFRIYYTKGAGVGFAHLDFIIYNFTISNASTEPVPDTIAPNPVTNVTCADNDTAPGVDGRDFTVGFDDSTDDSFDISYYDIYIYKDGEAPADQAAMDLLSASNKVARKTIYRTSGDDGADSSLGSGVTTDSKGQPLTAGDYWVIVTAKDSAGNYSFSKTAAKTSIVADVSVTLSLLDSALSENAGTATVTATLSGALSHAVTVNLGFSGTAIAVTDYTASDNKIVISAGETTGSLTLTGCDDSDYELSESIIIDITSVTESVENGTQQVTVTINDDDSAPTVELSQSGNSFSEQVGVAVITATLSNKSYQDVTVEIGLTGTAIAGNDYSVTPVNTPVKIVIPAGSQSGSLTLTAINDDLYEGNETISMEIANVINATEDGEQKVDLSITDNETAPSVTLSVSPSAFSEDAGTATITATLSNRSYQDVTVNISFTGTATGADYTATGTTIMIPALSATGTITLTGNDDSNYEGDETVITKISVVQNGTYDNTQQVITTITEDDPAPMISIGDATVSEGNSGTKEVEFTVELSAESGIITSVNYATTNGTAIAGTDYIPDSGTITFAPGETSKTIRINVNGNTLDEDVKNFEVYLSGALNATISDSSAWGTITDDDPAPAISINNVTVAEGDTGTANLIYTVTLSGASGKTVTVDCSTQDGTATTANNDYVVKTTTLTFASGETSKTITVTVNGDNVLEADETVLVKLSNPTNTTITEGQDTGTGTIANDDTPSISINDASIAEDMASLMFTVTLSKPSAVSVTVDYATTANTATAGTDYMTDSGTITFAPGDTSETITIAVNADLVDEDDETFYVSLSSATSGVMISDAQGVGTITDDDLAPAISIGDATVAEGNTGTRAVEFTVELSAESGKTISINYSTSNETAIAGTDYIPDMGAITFAPGEASKIITININGDTLDEDDKNFKVYLSGALNATISDSSAWGTITDDDPAPAISINNVTVAEGDTGTVNLIYTVTLSGASGKTVTVDCATQDGTATTADNDYEAETTTLAFAPGETSKTITVTVNGDNVLEDDETVLVKLSNPTNTTITAGQDTGTGTITNDEYTLTYTAGANGTITGTATQTVSSGANGTAVTATPNSGYYFVGWSDGVTATTRTDSNVTGNIAVTATFAINEYTLTYTAGANGTITGTATQTVSSGANGTAVTATPNSGYYFVGWSDGVATATRTDSNVTGNITVTATFAITSSPSPTTPITSTPSPTKEIRQVNVNGVSEESANAVTTIDIVREITNDKKIDTVTLNRAKTEEVLQNVLDQNQEKIQLAVDEPENDKADVIEFVIDKDAVKKLADSEVALDVKTEAVSIEIPKESVQGISENKKDICFRVLPIRNEVEKKATIQNAITAGVVQTASGNSEAVALGMPMMIESNYQGHMTTLVFSLKDIAMPEDETQRALFLSGLGVYINHSDGEQEFNRGRIIYDSNGYPVGIEIEISKFSTFILLSMKNEAPIASDLVIKGKSEYGKKLTASYTYNDKEQNKEGKSLFYWYRADNKKGKNKKQVAKGTLSYKVVKADQGKYLILEITPLATSGESTGSTVTAYVKVAANKAPKAVSKKISGKTVVGSKLSLKYTYQDAESDKEGKTTIQWFRADSAVGANKKKIKNANKLTYNLTKADQGKYIIAEITPVAKTGSKVGTKTTIATNTVIKKLKY